MDLRKQQFSKLYKEFINDYNLILISLNIIRELGISYINLEDIYYYTMIFRDFFNDYQTDISKSLKEIVKQSDLLIHTPSNKYIVNNKLSINDLSEIYNHYQKIKLVDDKFKIYLKEKYLRETKEDKVKQRRYRHVKKLI